jgi:hypothetical protein
MIYIIMHKQTSSLSSINFDNINESCCSSYCNRYCSCCGCSGCYNNYYINSLINSTSIYSYFYKNHKLFSKSLKLSDILISIKDILE